MNKIYYHYINVSSKLKSKKLLKSFLLDLFKIEKKKLKYLSIILCTDEFLLSLNQTYLNHNYYTDTMSFDLSYKGSDLIGEVYISIDRVKENAKERNIKKEEELLRVIFHGCLHLCGYSDKTAIKQKLMFKKQEAYISKWYVSRETKIK